MRPVQRIAVCAAVMLLHVVSALAQTDIRPANTTSPPPPATKLEAFEPAVGAVVTVGYDEIGAASGVSVDAREMRDSRGNVVRGIVVEVTQSEYRDERAFIDLDELPELLNGIDALLAVAVNPTSFEYFEVRYKTKGELEITAFNDRKGQVKYAVQAGRITRAQVFVEAGKLRDLRGFFESASQKLSSAK